MKAVRPGAALTMSCEVKSAARNGIGADVGWAGADKLQWHFAGRQQSIRREEGCAQGLDANGESAGVTLLMTEKMSRSAQNLKIIFMNCEQAYFGPGVLSRQAGGVLAKMDSTV